MWSLLCTYETINHVLLMESFAYLLSLRAKRWDECVFLLLTLGLVLSFAPAGAGCSRASEGWGWSRSHSPLSLTDRSTSHCWTSERHNVKGRNKKAREMENLFISKFADFASRRMWRVSRLIKKHTRTSFMWRKSLASKEMAVAGTGTSSSSAPQ